MCYRCVRFQDEVAGDQALSAIDRGGQSQIGVLEGETFDSPFSGNTVDICPVGALLSRQYRFQARPWDLVRTPSVCTGCAVGCNVELHSRRDTLLRMVPRENMAVNNEWLCDFGRFDTLPLGIERLTTPMVGGQPAAWETAVRAAAALLTGQGAGSNGSHGSRSDIEIVASPALTTEALDVLRSLASGLGASLSVWPARTGRVRGTITGLVQSRTIILMDFDVWRELPVLALRLREALRAGGRLYFVGTGPNGLQRDTAATFATADELLETVGQSLLGPVSIVGPGAEQLAERLEATGMVGLPATAANGWTMHHLPAARFDAPLLLLAGNENWPVPDSKRTISLRWSPSQHSALSTQHSDLSTQDSALRTQDSVLLPIAHPYEQTGTATNLDGHEQRLRAGARAPAGVHPDWIALAELTRALGLAADSQEARHTVLA